MKSSEIRKRFLEYFEKRGHTVVPSSPLVPEKDPTLLFTNAGMVQFKAVFLNEDRRDYLRAASCQKCMRAGGKHNDLENVGRTSRHHTFFEMLGNFSFGDYFKEGAIEYAWDFLTGEMKMPVEDLWVTVYEEDDESAGIWKEKTGLPEERIVKMGPKDNFWSMGDVGPCGPCSEILVDQGPGVGCGRPACKVGCDCDRYLEIWNLVFMQYNRDESGRLTALPRPCIDTGMGLERLTAVLQGKHSNYDSDLFAPIIEVIEEITGLRYGADTEKDHSIRAVADHARSITFLITDGVLPGNVGRGYVLRRIIRRAVRHGRFLGLHEPFVFRVNARVIELMGDVYPGTKASKDLIEKATRGEEERFFETLERGLALLEEEVALLKKKGEKTIPGSFAFRLYDTYGFPVDLTADIVSAEGLTVDESGFSGFMEEQRTKARQTWKGEAAAGSTTELYKRLVGSGLKSSFTGYTMDVVSSKVLCIIKDGVSVDSASEADAVEIITEETPFYGESGGQVGDTGTILTKDFSARVTDTKRPEGGLTVHHCKVEKGKISVDEAVELVIDVEKRAATRRNHTATHLLHAALRRELGEHVRQSGSLVAPGGFRFDFNHFEALTDEEIKKLEDAVNSAVLDNIEVVTDELPYKEAVERGALAFFGEKYSELVRVVQVPGVSVELCGGTHVRRTGDIGLVKILGESSVAAGVRRIEAVTGKGALESVAAAERALKEASELLRVPATQAPDKIRKLLDGQKALERELEKLRSRLKAGEAKELAVDIKKINDVNVLAARVEAEGHRELRDMADTLRAKIGSGIVVLGCSVDSKAVLLAAVTKDLTKKFSAGEIIKRIAPVVGGRGGGKPDLAQAGGNDPSRIDEAIAEACRTIEEMAGGA